MSLVLEGLALLLLASLVLGLVRIWHGPSFADRMLAAQLFGTTGVALLVLLAELLHMPALRDVALVLALLAVLTVLAFVARVWSSDQSDERAPERGAARDSEADGGLD